MKLRFNILNARFAAVALLALALLGAESFGAEVMPPKPERYFNDYAGVTPVELQQRLDRRLEALEKTNSTQVLVAVYPKMQSDSSIEDYAVRVAQSWKVGHAGKDNGAVLFVFVEDRKLYITVGYGLEGAIPDATASDIIRNRITPHFKNGDYGAGLTAGVDALIQAAAGEYQGTGRTVAGERGRRGKGLGGVGMLVLFLMFLAAFTRRKRGYVYGGRGRSGWGGPIIWTGGGGGWGGGRGGGGGWSGGFSGGGGSFGGGGAGGSW